MMIMMVDNLNFYDLVNTQSCLRVPSSSNLLTNHNDLLSARIGYVLSTPGFSFTALNKSELTRVHI